jgi:peptide/nickel transport system substrate-binding protein
MRRTVSFVSASTLLLLAACGPAAAPPPAATTAPAAPAATTAPAAPAATTAPAATAAAPAAAAPTTAAKPAAGARGQGDLLRIIYWQAPTILNSHLAQGTKDYDASRLVLEPLAAMGPDGKPVALLAAEVPTVDNGGVSRDLKTVTWKLKPGIKWSDGSDFTSADVVFTYQYVSDPATASTNSQVAAGVEKVEAPDPTTVVVTWQEPNPNPYQLFVGPLNHIIQKAQFENFMGAKAQDAPGNLAPNGTGPYKIKEFKPGDVVTYEINTGFRDPAKPFFKEVQIKGGGDATQAARAVFQTGESDYSWNLQVEAQVLNQLMQGGRGELVTEVSPNVERILINFADPNTEIDGARAEPTTKHPFLTDLKVRQALAMAVDRKSIAEQLYGPTGQATCNIVTTPDTISSKNTANMDVCKFDIAKANQLLDEAGWTRGSDGIREKAGVKMRLVYQTTVNPLRQREQDIVKAGWEQLGISVELKAVQSGVFFSTDVANPDTASKFYTDVEMFTNGADSPDPTNYLASWITKEIASKSKEWRGDNYHRYSNPEFDAMHDQLLKETDTAKRNELAIKMNDILISEVVVIPLVARTQPTDGKSKQLQGIVPNPWDSVLWNVGDWTKTN